MDLIRYRSSSPAAIHPFTLALRKVQH